MTSSSVEQGSGLLLSWESAGSVVEGSLAVVGSQRSEGGFTVYRIVFKVVCMCACVRACVCVHACPCMSMRVHACVHVQYMILETFLWPQALSHNPEGHPVHVEVSCMLCEEIVCAITEDVHSYMHVNSEKLLNGNISF